MHRTGLAPSRWANLYYLTAIFNPTFPEERNGHPHLVGAETRPACALTMFKIPTITEVCRKIMFHASSFNVFFHCFILCSFRFLFSWTILTKKIQEIHIFSVYSQNLCFNHTHTPFFNLSSYRYTIFLKNKQTILVLNIAEYRISWIFVKP